MRISGKITLTIIILLLAIVAFLTHTTHRNRGADWTELDKTKLTDCLKDTDATLYITTSSPACKAQLLKFGDAMRDVNIVICDNSDDPNEINPECILEKIEAYPTWIFYNNTQLRGVQSLDELADHIRCPKP